MTVKRLAFVSQLCRRAGSVARSAMRHLRATLDVGFSALICIDQVWPVRKGIDDVWTSGRMSFMQGFQRGARLYISLLLGLWRSVVRLLGGSV